MSLTLANCEHLRLLKPLRGQLRLKKVQPLLAAETCRNYQERPVMCNQAQVSPDKLRRIDLTSHSTASPGLLEQEFSVADCGMGAEAVDGNHPFHS